MSMQTIDLRELKLKPGERILDLGCGEGRHAISAYLLENIVAVGIDLSLKDLKITRERHLEFIDKSNPDKSLVTSVANGAKLPFEDHCFDKVICSEVLEHIPDYLPVLREIHRVLRPGGIYATSVPRFFPEWICWQLSDEYHEVEGGHVRIFNASHLRQDIEATGFIHFRRHFAHALHVPYWWLKCFFWRPAGEADAKPVSIYHRFLVWDLMKQPVLTRTMEWLLNPLMGKSVVMYFVKTAETPLSDSNHLERATT